MGNKAETIKAMIEKADPVKNPSVHERQNALRMAEKAMDKEGLSFASLGYSYEDAERIANQFSVAVGGGQRDERTSLNLFSRKPKPENHGIQKREPETVYVPWSTTPKKNVKAEAPTESYTERCEREDRERWDKQYDDMVAYQKQEAVKNAELSAWAERFIRNLIVTTVVVAALILFFSLKP